MAEYILAGALAASLAGMVLGYWRNPSLIPASRASDLRDEIQKLREENTACRAEAAKLAGRVTYLEGVVETLRGDARWWQEEWRRLQTETRDKGR